MRNRILAAAAVASTLVALAPGAQAVIRTDLDPITGKWVTYDTQSTNFFGAAKAIVRENVNYAGPYGPNTIIVDTPARRLYFVYEKGKALKYGIGVGREGYTWSGTDAVSMKAEWPGWTPPPEMVQREKAKGRILPSYMPGGVNNPLGARALYIGSRIYRIHGSNEPWTIGRAVSSGCIRMTNEDVIDLYDRVTVGTRVVVLPDSGPAIVAEEIPPQKPGFGGLFAPKTFVKAPLPTKAPPKAIIAVKASAKEMVATKTAAKDVVPAKVVVTAPAKKAAPIVVFASRNKDDDVTAEPAPIAVTAPPPPTSVTGTVPADDISGESRS
jgi:lipoprotein-anchoring transpeptidase ErfK/SrfK